MNPCFLVARFQLFQLRVEEDVMSSRIKLIIGIVATFFVFGETFARSLDEEGPVLAEALAKQLLAKGKTKVAAIDFTDLQSRPNELGRFIAEQLSVDMIAADGVTVIDRANLSAIMAEHQLTAEGLVKPENAKKLGQFAGVDAILIGNLAPLENMVVLTVKAISTDTSEVVAAGRLRIDITKDIQRMLGQSVAVSTTGILGSATSPSTGGVASAVEGGVIATREVGPVSVVLRNVISYSIISGTEKVPAVRFTFDFNNRGLQYSLAVAANQSIIESPPEGGWETAMIHPVTGNWRGGAIDSSQVQWLVPRSGLAGIAGIYCFDTQQPMTYKRDGQFITQNNVASVVDYVHHGTQYNGKGLNLESNPTGRYWSGSFTKIPPGKSARVTLDLVPSVYLQTEIGGGSNRRKSEPERPPITMPDFFQFDIELVVGTFIAGESPEKSKDLSLRNLTIDRVVLPTLESPK